MLSFDSEDKYHGYDIYGHGGMLTPDIMEKGPYYSASLIVSKSGKEIFMLSCCVTTYAIGTHGKSHADAPNILCQEGLKWVHGLIDLQRFEEGGEYKYWVTFDEKSGSLTDSEICDELLRALYRIRRWYPRTYEYEYIDVEGFCDALGISRDEYLFNAKYLLEKGLIHEAPSDQLSVDTGYIHITDTGIDMVHKESMIGKVIATIFNETEKFVNAELIHVCPEAATKLLETYEDLMRDESTLRAKQIALACRDILQDFTIAPLKWAVIPKELQQG